MIDVVLKNNVVPLTRTNLGSVRGDRMALDLPADLPFEEWALIGDLLATTEGSINWWIGDWWAHGGKYGERSRVLEQLRDRGHNPPAFKTCKNAASVARAFERSRRRDLLSFDHHATVAKLDANEQDWMLGRATGHGWTCAQMRDEVRRYNAEKIRRPGERRYETQTVDDLFRLAESGAKFGTIYADPAWPYENQGTRAATHNHYKEHNTLSVEDICNLPVPKLTADAAHCHLCTTNGFLRESFVVLERWGFEYKSCFVWIKPDLGIGNYWRVGHEFILFGIKGKAPFGDNGEASWIYQKAGEHSAKPPKIRRIIERTSPGPWLELFGRLEVENWTVWGNEIERLVKEDSLL